MQAGVRIVSARHLRGIPKLRWQHPRHIRSQMLRRRLYVSWIWLVLVRQQTLIRLQILPKSSPNPREIALLH